METPEDKKLDRSVFAEEQQEQGQDPLVGRTFDFERSGEDGLHSTSVTVEKVIEEISGLQGFSDWVKLVECSVGGSEHKVRCVLKKLGGQSIVVEEENDKTYRTRHLEKNLEVYRVMKKLGLPVFQTFRINREQGLILMTDGTHSEEGEVYLLSGNNMINALQGKTSDLFQGEYGLEGLDEFDTQIEEMFEKLENAQNAGWYIQGDTFGFFVNKYKLEKGDEEKRQKMRLILFDFDQVSQRRPANPLCQDNRINFLYGLAGTNVPPWKVLSMQISFSPMPDGFLTYVKHPYREFYKKRAIELLLKRKNLPSTHS